MHAKAQQIERTKTCQSCQRTFSCFDSGCWCNDLPPIMPLEEALGCSCPNCLKGQIIKRIDETIANLTPESFKQISALGPTKNIVENIDYYLNESGKFVLTSWFHLRRGTCCGNGCKHCPYPLEFKS